MSCLITVAENNKVLPTLPNSSQLDPSNNKAKQASITSTMSRDSERPPLKTRNTSGSDTTPYDDVDDFQDVDGRRIDPTKLVTFLKKTFNEGNYEVHRIHDIYSVRAPRRLSIDELQLCM